MWELGDKKEDNNADEHCRCVAALAGLGLGLPLDCRQIAVLAPCTSKQPLTAFALTTDGEDEQKAEQRHEYARQEFDDQCVDPEVHHVQRSVDGGRVRLTGRRNYFVHRPIRFRISAAGDG